MLKLKQFITATDKVLQEFQFQFPFISTYMENSFVPLSLFHMSVSLVISSLATGLARIPVPVPVLQEFQFQFPFISTYMENSLVPLSLFHMSVSLVISSLATGLARIPVPVPVHLHLHGKLTCALELVSHVLQEFQLGGHEEDMLTDVDMCRTHAPDPMFQANPSLKASSSSTSRTSTGHVRDVCFLDLDVACNQLSSQHALLAGSGQPMPSANGIKALQGRRLLVAVCESKVMVYDLLTRHVNEIGKITLEGKTPTCVSFLFMPGQAFGSRGTGVMPSPVLAIGCSDGIVRLVQLGSLKSGIACVSTFIVPGTSWEQVVVGHSSGSIAAWEPFSHGISSTVSDCTSKSDIKGHDKDVVGMGLVCVKENAELPSSMLFTCSLDNKIVGWERLRTAVYKHKVDQKAMSKLLSIKY
eukprot:gene23774-9333_t